MEIQLLEKEPEIWKPIMGYEGLYEISNYGQVKSFFRSKEKILKHQIHNGYTLIHLQLNGKKNRKGFNIHRLVGLHFVENLNNDLQINHIDGNKSNNFYKNLEWCSQEYNIEHAIKNKLLNNTGINNGGCKLTEEQVLEIKNLFFNKKIKQNVLAKMYNISNTQIYRIVTNKRWKHL